MNFKTYIPINISKIFLVGIHSISYIDMTEFVINNFLKLKLENGKTIIYIDNKRVLQCKYLLLSNPVKKEGKNMDNNQNITIDNQTLDLDHSLEVEEQNDIDLLPETEFWAHCSNLHVWYEHDYNTQVLHSNLAFPLLKKLAEAGDQLAREVFKKEIIKRFRSGNLNVMTFLIKEGYLDYLSIEKSEELYQELEFETYKELQKQLQDANKTKERFII